MKAKSLNYRKLEQQCIVNHPAYQKQLAKVTDSITEKLKCYLFVVIILPEICLAHPGPRW